LAHRADSARGLGTDAPDDRDAGSATLGAVIPRSLPDRTDEPLVAAVAEIGTALRLESVTIVGDTTTFVRWGAPSGPGTELELRHRGELVGVLQVTPRPSRTLLPRDRAVLQALASVAAAAVVADRDAADVRRTMHDRVGPTLAGIGLGLQGVRNLVRDNPAAGLDLLIELQIEVDAAAASVLMATLPLVGNDD
jgi:hypothetical protein